MSGDDRPRLQCVPPLPDAPDPASEPRDKTAHAISRALARILRAHAGRGPTKASTALSSDLAIVTLEDCLTEAEEILVSEGHTALTTQLRAALHAGMRVDAVAAVEGITGRWVAAYLTAHQHDPDVSVIAFHFGPPGGVEDTDDAGGRSRTG